MRIRRLALLAASAAMLAPIGCATTSPAKPACRADPPGPAPSATPPAGPCRISRFPASVVQDAVVEAMEDLSFTVTRRGQDGPASQIEGGRPITARVTVTLRPQKPITRVSCRVGWFGDEPLSRTVLRRIAVRLGTLPPEAIPDKVPSEPAPNPYFSRDAIPDSEMMKRHDRGTLSQSPRHVIRRELSTGRRRRRPPRYGPGRHSRTRDRDPCRPSESEDGRDHAVPKDDVIDTPLRRSVPSAPSSQRRGRASSCTPGRHDRPDPRVTESCLRHAESLFWPFSVRAEPSIHAGSAADREAMDRGNRSGGHAPDRLATDRPNRGEPPPCRLESTLIFLEEVSRRRSMIMKL